MQRTPVNPTEWGLAFQMHQGEVVEGVSRVLRFSGQVALEEDAEAEYGVRVVHEGDMRGQIQAALSAIDEILQQAGMTRANLLSVRTYTTDIGGYLENADAFNDWLAEADTAVPQTLLGVAALAIPGLLVEIEAEAGA